MKKNIVTEEEIKQKIQEKDLVIYADEVNAGGLCFDLFVCGLVIKKEDLDKSLNQDIELDTLEFEF